MLEVGPVGAAPWTEQRPGRLQLQMQPSCRPHCFAPAKATDTAWHQPVFPPPVAHFGFSDPAV